MLVEHSFADFFLDFLIEKKHIHLEYFGSFLLGYNGLKKQQNVALLILLHFTKLTPKLTQLMEGGV